jgi:hypothetical protein
MVRKTLGRKKWGKDDEKYDFDSLKDPGITMLKFGRSGTPHERVIHLSGNPPFVTFKQHSSTLLEN